VVAPPDQYEDMVGEIVNILVFSDKYDCCDYVCFNKDNVYDIKIKK